MGSLHLGYEHSGTPAVLLGACPAKPHVGTTLRKLSQASAQIVLRNNRRLETAMRASRPRGQWHCALAPLGR